MPLCSAQMENTVPVMCGDLLPYCPALPDFRPVGLQQPPQIAKRKEPSHIGISRQTVFLPGHGGHMVHPDRPLKPLCQVSADGLIHVGLAVVMKGLVKMISFPRNIPEMDKKQLVLTAEMPDAGADVLPHS